MKRNKGDEKRIEFMMPAWCSSENVISVILQCAGLFSPLTFKLKMILPKFF